MTFSAQQVPFPSQDWFDSALKKLEPCLVSGGWAMISNLVKRGELQLQGLQVLQLKEMGLDVH